ncbi:hypothetical protein EYB53_019955 [Candidatus Chloroploca sp. M-50]|uniref:Uncharacterized protein n=1 Tax=Candidatus Chloroploca mongolica TaxID=2528176 RepID=A0ABS4DEZ5_9CHLR|nr:hypothetical protein [Candidatus Chloroploca mongolica]MBP1468002.1 hypothetical protein [Candidatus Chloroploca mongolica]
MAPQAYTLHIMIVRCRYASARAIAEALVGKEGDVAGILERYFDGERSADA